MTESIQHRFLHSMKGAVLSYRGTVEALGWKPVLMTSVFTPIFYLLFFFLVRAQSIPKLEIPAYLLMSILILPVGVCVFYIGGSFTKLKRWGLMRSLLLSDRSLLNIALHITMVTVVISFAVSLFWCLLLELVFVDFNLNLAEWLTYFFILLCSILTCASFGIFCALVFLPMKDTLVIANSLFFVVIIFSGLIIQADTGWIYWLSHLLPLTSYISILKSLVQGDPNYWFFLIGLCNFVGYLVLAKLLVFFAVQQMQQGENEY